MILRLKNPVSITFIENLRSETILANYNLHSLLAMLNILPSTCIYYGAVYLNYTQFVLLTLFKIQYDFSWHLINTSFWRTGGARAPGRKYAAGPVKR